MIRKQTGHTAKTEPLQHHQIITHHLSPPKALISFLLYDTKIVSENTFYQLLILTLLHAKVNVLIWHVCLALQHQTAYRDAKQWQTPTGICQLLTQIFLFGYKSKQLAFIQQE